MSSDTSGKLAQDFRLVDRRGDAPPQLRSSTHSGETRSGSSSSGTCSPVYAGVSNALIVSTCHPEPGLQIVAKWEAGSSGFPTATTRASMLVARASIHQSASLDIVWDLETSCEALKAL